MLIFSAESLWKLIFEYSKVYFIFAWISKLKFKIKLLEKNILASNKNNNFVNKFLKDFLRL